jgi:perosamine synthetase
VLVQTMRREQVRELPLLDADGRVVDIVSLDDTFVPLAAPSLGPDDLAAIQQCLEGGWVSTASPYVDQFERSFSSVLGVKHAVATASGTAALHLALLVCGVKPDDEVIVSTLSFIAPANAIRYVGAWPVFIDAEPNYWQMDPQKLSDFLTRDCEFSNGVLRNRHSGRRVIAILPVHILGHPCDIETIAGLARKYGLRLIEDASESLGARYRSQSAGSFGDAACFSFNGNKVITTGGGGMLVTNDERLAARAGYLSLQARDEPSEYIHGEIGYNYRMVGILAALGCAQLQRLGEHVRRKRVIAAAYAHGLTGVPGVELPRQSPDVESTFWLYTAAFDEGVFRRSSRELIRQLASLNVQARPLWQPLHMSPPHRAAYHVDCSVSERLYRDAVSLPCSPDISDEDFEVVTTMITNDPAAGARARQFIASQRERASA